MKSNGFLSPKRTNVQNLDDAQKKLFQWTEKENFHPFKFFYFLFVGLVTRVQFRSSKLLSIIF